MLFLWLVLCLAFNKMLRIKDNKHMKMVKNELTDEETKNENKIDGVTLWSGKLKYYFWFIPKEIINSAFW